MSFFMIPTPPRFTLFPYTTLFRSSGVIASSVTGITQNSSTSALTLSGPSVAYTGGVRILNGTLNVNNPNGVGNAAVRTTVTRTTRVANTVFSGDSLLIVSPIIVAG